MANEGRAKISQQSAARIHRLTHAQYEELRTFEHGHPSYRFHAPAKSLTRNGLLKIGAYGHDRASSAFQITDEGLAALAAYRERWKVSV